MRPDRGMELHHKLRRDPSWHPSSCNICGQLGHQAANCTTGTINWRQIYGEDAFRIKPPIYWSDIVKKQKAKEVNFEELEKRARDYARMQCENQGVDYDAMIKGAQAFQAPPNPQPQQPPMQPNPIQAAAPQVNPGQPANPAANPIDPMEGIEIKPDPDAPPPVPEGWAVAHDQQGRVYYWHKKTQKVQWERPTGDTPV
ncbi:hypothetical protein BSKO_12356 [Bryopsis sp. KO-2023]|nr:hypothetical protein BSKO_12356 [Bryopsis sp. KO-2023]